MGKDKINGLKKFFKDSLSPFLFIFNFMLEGYKITISNIKENKELIIIVTYGLGLFLQCLFLFIGFGVEGLNYLSIKFSLILLFIIGFLGFLGLPLIILILIIYSIFIFLGLWWLFLILFLIILILKKVFKLEPNKKKIEKLDNFFSKSYFIYVIVIVIVFGLFFISQYSVTKPVEVITKHGKVIGDLNFYNQDYYFIDNCNQKLVIPESEVIGVNYLCPVLKCTDKKLEEVQKFKEFRCKVLKAPKLLFPIKKN